MVMTGEREDEDAEVMLQLGMGGCAQIDAHKGHCEPTPLGPSVLL